MKELKTKLKFSLVVSHYFSFPIKSCTLWPTCPPPAMRGPHSTWPLHHYFQNWNFLSSAILCAVMMHHLQICTRVMLHCTCTTGKCKTSQKLIAEETYKWTDLPKESIKRVNIHSKLSTNVKSKLQVTLCICTSLGMQREQEFAFTWLNNWTE